MKGSVSALVVLVLALPECALAQTPAGATGGEVGLRRAQEVGGVRMLAGQDDQAPPQRRVVALAAPVETRITEGRPYSAEAVTEITQVFGDGNRIQRSSMTKVFRDGQGRTRREMYAEDGVLRSVSINDPVNHVSWSLDPQQKIARRSAINIVSPSGAPPRVVAGGGRGGVATVTGEAPVSVPPEPPRVVAGASLPRQPADVESNAGNARTEDLGVQTIEGVLATGKRTTTTIPAGQIGNLQDIRIVSEQWFSDELQVLVMTKHSDPRSGETTYRLRNILRAEPDPSLFSAPPDYTVQQRSIRPPE